jgi:hypothetical protein
MSPEKDALDVGLIISMTSDEGRKLIDLALVDVVAKGKLFILSNDGKFLPVEMADYWKQGSLLTVCRQGYEFDQDGETTRDWRDEAVQS